MSADAPKPKRIVSLAQHPMWLIIKEDTVCAERTPPWGAPSVEEYSKRLDRNLQTLEKNPGARLSFDFSAAELEDVQAMYPGMAKRMVAAVKRGQLGFVNGTFSQPHLQMFSLEASVREVGLEDPVDQRLGHGSCAPGASVRGGDYRAAARAAQGESGPMTRGTNRRASGAAAQSPAGVTTTVWPRAGAVAGHRTASPPSGATST
jgi:hypothetical protein